jgi:heat shock protein 5
MARRSLTLFALSFHILAWLSAGDEKKPKIDGPVIGIDLGTTYSCVGIFKNGRVEIIANDQGNRITPSYVAFDKGQRLVGEAAKNQASMNPTETIYDVKRLIGRRFKESQVQSDIKLLPYKIEDRKGKPHIRVTVSSKGTEQLMAPEEISAIILGKMKETAENFLGKSVGHAVITVPAYFNDAQRQATKDAGSIIGLNVVRIINEPTAAAIAYGLDQQGEKTILVFDLGGGTFDVSMLTIDNGVFEVAATSGNTHLGGEDFDQRVLEHFTKVFKQKHGKDISKNKRALAKMRREVEKAKRMLSGQHQARVEIESLMDGIDLSETLTRAQFEKLNLDLFKKTIEPVDQVMKDSGFEKSQIDEIVLVGGSTRIPKVQELLREYFPGKELNQGVNPDEAVAYGAAVQAGILSGEQGGQELLLLDVTPLTMGVDVKGGSLSAIIPRNTVIPTTKESSYTTVDDYQTAITFNIYEGERPMAKDNHKLGKITISGLPPTKAGVPDVTVKFYIDANVILQVTATDQSTGKAESVTIANDKGRLSEEQIERMLRDAEKFAEEDKRKKEQVDAREVFESYMRSMRNSLEGPLKEKLDSEDMDTVKSALSDASSWLDSNKDADAEEIKEKQNEVESVCGPIVGKIYGGSSGDAESDSGSDDEEDGEL